MSVTGAKQRQAQERINQAGSLAKSLVKPNGGWIATFQAALGMNAPALAERLAISRNNTYAAIQNEQAGTISFWLKPAQRLDALNRPGFTGGQNSRRIARYGTDIKEENREAVFT